MSAISNADYRSSLPAGGVASPFDFAARTHRRAAFLLLVVSLLAFLPGFFRIPPVDRDEAYFAQATKQMIETGDYVDIRYRDEVRYRKPIGIYWLQAGVVRAAQMLGVPDAGNAIWLYRVPSLAGAIGAVLATYWCALAFVPRRGAFMAGLMLATSIALGTEARLAKTDAVLLFTVVVAMGVLARAYLLPRSEDAGLAPPDGGGARGGLGLTLPFVFWTALAASILVKGPLIVMVAGLAAATLSIVDRSARWLLALRPLAGLVWLCLLVLPWFIAIFARSGDSFLVDSVGHDMLAKLGGGQETHGAPPGFYVLLFFVTFFPGSALALPAAPAVWAARREPRTRFLLAWLVPSWIVFELVTTKLPHYVLPLYPAIAILIAGATAAKSLSQRPALAGATIWWIVVPVVVSAGALAAAVTIGRDLAFPAWPFLAAAIASGAVAWRKRGADGAARGLLCAAASAILLAIAGYGIVLPALKPLFPAVQLAGVLHHASCRNPVAASAGYGEPSLVFLAGTATRLTDGAGAADFLRGGDCRFAFVEASEQRAFMQRSTALGLHDREGPHVDGFNISKGRRISVTVFQPAAAP